MPYFTPFPAAFPPNPPPSHLETPLSPLCYPCWQFLPVGGNDSNGQALSQAPRRSARRRPLSTEANPPQQQPTRDREPPPPPPRPPPPTPYKSGPFVDSGGGGGIEARGDAAAATAATGVTVGTTGGTDGGGENPVDLLFQPCDDHLENGGSNPAAAAGAVGSVGTSLDDAWKINDSNSSDAGGLLRTPADSTAPLNDGVGAGAQNSPESQPEAARPGDERAHKIWVTGDGVGDSVSEHEWAERASGSGKEDTAVIQFHSLKEAALRRFEGFGVIKEDKAEDIHTLVESFTAPALAAALRDRETALHMCAHLLEQGDLSGVRKVLLPFTAKQVAESRRALGRLDLEPEGFTKTHMYALRKVLQRLPRHVTTLTEQRASVMVPLCNVDGVASVLFTKRSGNLRAYKNDVCFPGGKVDIGQDQHIIQTAVREMGEEIGILESSVDVLGVLRCDWSEVASLIGVAVTPVVGFLGNLSLEQIHPNPDEVSHCFTIPVRFLLQEDRWQVNKYAAPAFVGGPYQIWGLTGYILRRLVNDVLRQHLAVI
ncbi:unnamed protein product [Ectocarpus sp. CCAP 1310/34]|nr:unnamed protein product [Ectocarpus sp. CCAP 1310/34]